MAPKRKVGQVFLPLDVEFFDNDKVHEAGEKAGWLYLAMSCRSKHKVSDGVLSPGQIDRLGISGWKQRLSDLLRVGLVEEHPAGYYISGWQERNSTASELEEIQRRKAEGALLGNHNRWHSDRPRADCPHCTDRSSDADPIAAPIVLANGSDPSETETEGEGETEQDRGKTSLVEPPARRSDVEAICSAVADHAEVMGGKRPTVTDAWRTQARLLLDADGRTEEQVLWMVRWIATDPFWSRNVLAVPTLRKQFPQLFAKSRPALVRPVVGYSDADRHQPSRSMTGAEWADESRGSA